MAKRYAPAQQDISAQHNRLMYTLVKLLWLGLPISSRTQSPDKTVILKAYERIQHCILVEDPVLSKVGIPLPKINIKTVCDFIRRQEKLPWPTPGQDELVKPTCGYQYFNWFRLVWRRAQPGFGLCGTMTRALLWWCCANLCLYPPSLFPLTQVWAQGRNGRQSNRFQP